MRFATNLFAEKIFLSAVRSFDYLSHNERLEELTEIFEEDLE